MKEIIYLAAGCFWCYQPIFDKLPGVISTRVGYIGGKTQNPTYEDVCTGNTGHAEAIEIVFDNNVISLDEILDIFWQIHDPTSLNKQGNDIGNQYRSAIFCQNEQQFNIANKSKSRVQNKFSRPIVTEIVMEKNFYSAEDYHQHFYNKNPVHPYCRVVISPKLKKARNLYK